MSGAIDELGKVGVTMNTSILYLHPVGNRGRSPLVSEHRITWMVGAPFEDTIAAMQLITSGHLQRYPAVKIICSHLGGALPMIPLRADDHVAWETPDIPQPASQAAHRLWYDTVSHCHGSALRCAIDTFGFDRILLGTDFPYEDGDTFVRAVAYIDETADPSEAHAILEANAMALFGIRA